MTVTPIVARMYDAQGQKLSSPSSSEKGFEEVVNKIAAEGKSDTEVCARCAHSQNLNPTLVSHKISEEVAAGDDEIATDKAEAATVEPAVARTSAAWRFSIFIRTTSDMSSFGESMLDKFRQATRNFVQALRQDGSSGISVFDRYLQNASDSVGKGLDSGKSFINQMLEAADNGLKAVTATMNSASMMNGFNLSMNSALPGTSSADIAGIYLQEAMKNGSIGGSATTGLKSTKTAQLQLIRTDELLSAPPALSPQQMSSPLVKDQILDQFVQMLDAIINPMPAMSRSEMFFSFNYVTAAGEKPAAAEPAVSDKMPEDQSSGEEKVTL